MNRNFITVSSIGQCTEKGAIAAAMSFKKIVAKTNHPITELVRPIVGCLLELGTHDSNDALIADVTLLRDKLDNLLLNLKA